MNTNTNISFYIPKMANKYCHEEWIQALFDKEEIGEVSRVEFKTIKGNQKYKRAIVYMAGELYCSEIGTALYNSVILKNDKTFQFFPDETKTDYWLILRNNKNTLEETIAKQNEQIAELIQEIEKLKKSVADLVKTA